MPEWTTPQDAAPPAPPKPLASWYAQGLADGLGDRLLMFDNSTAPSLELLRFRPDLAQVPGFEAALRDQVHRLAQFRHPAFARVRAVQRLEPDDDLALISNCTPGKRLSDVLHRARGAAFAAAMIEQLAPALVLFQQHGVGVSHGVLSPERIIVSPDGRLTIVEHVVGPAIDTLGLGTAHLTSLGIALPPAAGDSARRLDVATDWYQLGLVAVSVLLGRQVTAGDLPQLERLLDGVGQSAGRDGTVLSPWIRQWLDRALQLSSTRIESGADARAALDELLHREQPGGLRSLEGAPRTAGAASTAPSATAETGPVEPVADASPVVGAPQPPVTDAPTTLAAPTAAQAETPPRVRTPDAQVPLTDFRTEIEANRLSSPGAQVHPPEPSVARTVWPPEPIVARTRPLDSRKPASADAPGAATRPPVRRDPQAAPQPRAQNPPAATPRRTDAVRRGVSTTVVAALMLMVALEAGVIALMTRALWFAAPPAIAVQTAASGENVLVSSRPAESTPLRLSAAPDLSWVSVTSPSVEGVLGGKVTPPRTGTIQISSPINLKVFEHSRQLGSVPGEDLKVTPGRHEIELVNLPFAYRLTQSIEVEAGQTVSIHVAPAHGWVTVYAVPTADVSIDGKSVGRTPLGPLPLALGEHTVTFTHPTGATDRQRIMVKSGETIRVIGNPRR